METEQILRIEDIARVEAYTPHFSRMTDKYLCWRLEPGMKPIATLEHPLRLDGMVFVMCHHGSLRIEINFQEYHAQDNTLVVITPKMLFRIFDLDYSSIDAYVLFLSSDFLSDVNIDLNAINIRSLFQRHTPVTTLTPDETTLFTRFLELFGLIAVCNADSVYSRNTARSLVSSCVYQLLEFNFSRLNRIEMQIEQPANRRLAYVRDFMHLVHNDYMRHRDVSYYAKQLYISPKYLSMIIRDATGRSAADWINEFVVLEAKNLIKFSGKNIQQVAYALNFTNQSAFGKYFKHLTGMSPSEYQKS